jgi:hypothetical protein
MIKFSGRQYASRQDDLPLVPDVPATAQHPSPDSVTVKPSPHHGSKFFQCGEFGSIGFDRFGLRLRNPVDPVALVLANCGRLADNGTICLP